MNFRGPAGRPAAIVSISSLLCCGLAYIPLRLRLKLELELVSRLFRTTCALVGKDTGTALLWIPAGLPVLYIKEKMHRTSGMKKW